MLLNFRPAASASPGSLLKFQILGPYPRPTELKCLGVGLRNLCFSSLHVSLMCVKV